MDGPAYEQDAPGRPASLHDADFYAWSLGQAEALREKRFEDLDLPNLIDEVGCIAREEVRRLRCRLERLCHQMLLWDYGRLPRTPSRAAAVAHQRRRVMAVLERCPSLEAVRRDALAHGFEFGRYGALIEDESLTEADLPAMNPYSWDDIMRRSIGASTEGVPP